MSAPAAHVGAVVLAAGEATRFGAQKLLADVDGVPLLQHAVDVANESSLDPILIVTGADADAIAVGIRPGRARFVHNAAYRSGQASSLRAGVDAMPRDVDAIVVILGDQPYVTPALIDALVTEQRAAHASAVQCAQQGRRSPPTLLHRDLFAEIAHLSGDTGARDVLTRRTDVAVVEVDHSLARLDDVDTRADWERLHGR